MSDSTGAKFIVGGQVQGVGFRPFVWRLAKKLKLSGSACNTSLGVSIEVFGSPAAIELFATRLETDAPPLARIVSIERFAIQNSPSNNDFVILPSESETAQKILVSPDVGVCPQCLQEMRDPANLRFNHAFANCTDCGPRFSITTALPYDRIRTTMGCFPPCPDCASQYADPADRRFHAQPVACPHCGPRLWFVAKGQTETTAGKSGHAEEALAKAGSLLLAGGIIALKGIGGFQLACDARNDKAVQTLRSRKKRPHKAFAVMCQDSGSLSRFCIADEKDLTLLESPARPIVCLPKNPRSRRPLSPAIAPDVESIGVMTPTTPLHALLLDWLADRGMDAPALVMTSANPAGEPICLGNREALERLADLADGWLLHDRDILSRVDDSVLLAPPCAGAPYIYVRRARGYVPSPVPAGPGASASVLGTGPELKTTFCLTRDDQAFVGQHIGDLESAATLEFYKSAYRHLKNLLEVSPQLIVRDLHPDFISSRFAETYGAENHIPVATLQHHAAHAASVLAENSCFEPALALCLDGTGLGEDGHIWGGELIWMDLSRAVWERAGSLKPFHLPGGDTAAREPWRIAEALVRAADWRGELKLAVDATSRMAVREMLDKNLRCMPTSSCGRLFDGVSAMLGLCLKSEYEGQAAVRLEQAAVRWLQSNWNGIRPMPETSLINVKQQLSATEKLLKLDSPGLAMQIAEAISMGAETGRLAYEFHLALAAAYAEMCRIVATKKGLKKIGLSGGVFNNRLFANLLQERLRSFGLEPLWHRELPPGDGGVSYGQAVWGRRLLAKA